MSRRFAEDFEKLKSFLEDYTLSSFLADSSAQTSLKTSHRDFLSFLSFWASVNDLASRTKLKLQNKILRIHSETHNYFQEAVSDIGSGFFCSIHGAYKPANMVLRSSIENFLRFLVSINSLENAKSRDINSLFLSAKPLCIDSFSKNNLTNIKTLYSNLCGYVHSSEDHQFGIESFNQFPEYDDQLFREWARVSRQCMSSIITIILFIQPDIYHKAHYSNKELIERMVSANARTALLKGKTR